MTQKTSLFNSSVVLNDLKRFGFLGVIYFIILAVWFPIKVFSEATILRNEKLRDPNTYKFYGYGRVFRVFETFDDTFLIICFFGVIAALAVFNYIHSQKETEFIHSLPVNRRTLYMSHVASGFIIYILPMLIAVTATVIIYYTSGMSSIAADLIASTPYTFNRFYINAHSIILFWSISTIVLHIYIYCVSIFIAFLTGNTILHAIFAAIALVFPFGIQNLIVQNLDIILLGKSINASVPLMSYINFLTFFRQSPFFYGAFSLSQGLIVFTLITLFSIVLVAAGKVLYESYKAEFAGSTISFSWLKPIFACGFSTCLALAFVGLFIRSSYISTPKLVLCYAASAILGYCSSWILAKKSIRILKELRGFPVFICVFLAVFAIFRFDLIGYNKVPDAQDIKSIYFSYGNYQKTSYIAPNGMATYDRGLQSPENIAAITGLHKSIVNNKGYLENEMSPYKDGLSMIHINYVLNNEENVTRIYDIPVFDPNFSPYFKTVYESSENRELKSSLPDESDVNKITSIKFKPINIGEECYIKEADYLELVRCLKNDAMNISFDTIAYDDSVGYFCEIIISMDDESKYISRITGINKSSYRFLINKGYSDYFSKNINNAVVYKIVNEKLFLSDYLNRGRPENISGTELIADVKDRDLINDIYMSVQDNTYRYTQNELYFGRMYMPSSLIPEKLYVELFENDYTRRTGFILDKSIIDLFQK